MQYNQEGFGTVETLSSLSAENGRGRGFDSLGGLAIYPHPFPIVKKGAATRGQPISVVHPDGSALDLLGPVPSAE